MTKLMLFAALIFVTLACSPTAIPRSLPPPPAVALPPELARVLTDYERCRKGKDAAALAALFTEDGLVLSLGSPMVRGRAAIEQHYLDSGRPFSLRAAAFGIDGDLGYIIGAFSNSAVGAENGKFTLTLRRDPTGRWLIPSDMDNGDARR